MIAKDLAPDQSPLRLLIYDATCTKAGLALGLSDAWRTGAALYRGLGRIHYSQGVSNFLQAFEFLAAVAPGRRIAEVQFWGHGKWGEARVGTEAVGERTLLREHPLHGALLRVRERFLPNEETLFWFRTCETLGARRGATFARAWADFWRCRVAGHTYVIGDWQSGLHSLRPGAEPHWSPDEGLIEGSSETPRRAAWSKPWLPNTIHCLRGSLPRGY